MAAQRRNSAFWWFAAGLLAVLFVGLSLVAGGTSSAATLEANQSAPPATNTFTPTPTITPTFPTNTPTPNCPSNYTVTQTAGATIVAGTSLVPSSLCDDCAAPVALPFAYTLYGQSFTSASVTANGQMAFATPVDASYTNYCLPDPNSSYAIFAHWSDLTTDATSGGLQQCIDIGCGIYTSVSGTAPNRIFNVEWRTVSLDYLNPVSFEIRLYEGQQKFDIIYGAVETAGNFSGRATIGAQNNNGSTIVEYQSPPTNSPPCSGRPGSLVNGTKLTFNMTYFCTQATATSTSTSTPTRTSTPSGNPLLVGHVTWQSRPAQPNPLNALPISLTLRLQSGGPDLEFTGLTTDASGYFTAPVGSVPLGTYNWRVKSAQPNPTPTNNNPGFLATSGAVNLTGASSTSVEMGLQRAGDSNNDNLVTAVDFIEFKVSFGLQPGQQGWDSRADYNGDNLVTAVDFIQVKVNFGFGGAPPILPGRQ